MIWTGTRESWNFFQRMSIILDIDNGIVVIYFTHDLVFQGYQLEF